MTPTERNASLADAIATVERFLNFEAFVEEKASPTFEAMRIIIEYLRPKPAPDGVTDDWQPTAANVNALPVAVRRYIHALETDCDPAGTIRSEVILREHLVPELQAALLASQAEVARGRALLDRYEKAMTSHVDGRDLLEELNPAGWHHCDIDVRINGQNRRYEGDWLKNVWYARKAVRAAAIRSLSHPDTYQEQHSTDRRMGEP